MDDCTTVASLLASLSKSQFLIFSLLQDLSSPKYDRELECTINVLLKKVCIDES